MYETLICNTCELCARMRQGVWRYTSQTSEALKMTKWCDPTTLASVVNIISAEVGSDRPSGTQAFSVLSHYFILVFIWLFIFPISFSSF